jgi:hypothetical protein
MPQTVWHKKDIENVLRAMEMACQHVSTRYGCDDSDGFRQGFLAALAATATSFGIQVNDTHVRSISDSQAALLAQLQEPVTCE